MTEWHEYWGNIHMHTVHSDGTGTFDDLRAAAKDTGLHFIIATDHNVLVAFTEYKRNVIRLEPPLICGREHVDEFIAALDAVLGRGIVRIVRDFIGSQTKK